MDRFPIVQVEIFKRSVTSRRRIQRGVDSYQRDLIINFKKHSRTALTWYLTLNAAWIRGWSLHHVLDFQLFIRRACLSHPFICMHEGVERWCKRGALKCQQQKSSKNMTSITMLKRNHTVNSPWFAFRIWSMRNWCGHELGWRRHEERGRYSSQDWSRSVTGWIEDFTQVGVHDEICSWDLPAHWWPLAPPGWCCWWTHGESKDPVHDDRRQGITDLTGQKYPCEKTQIKQRREIRRY